MTMNFQTIRAQSQGPLGRLTLNRPGRLNAMNAAMLQELVEAARFFDADREVRVVIVSGAGRAFCAGADLKDSPVREAAYTYDVNNLRIAKDVDGVVTWFVYDGANVVMQFNYERSTGQTFLHGPAVDQVLANMRENGDIFWSLGDHQGSVRDIISNSGSPIDKITYSAFGAVTAETAPNTHFLFGYTGAVFDIETGLGYHRARYLDHATGRWLSEDPIGFDGDPSNLYRYVSNSPTNWTDPTGEVEFKITPEKVASMDWYSSTLGGKGEVGRTVILNLAAPYKGKASGCGGTVSFTVKADIHIRLDLKELAKTKTARTLAYGHEQVHVANIITILQRESKILAEVEGMEFDTPAAAKEAAEAAIKKFDTAVHNAVDLDADHKSVDPKSPPKGKGVPQQGTMKKEPKGAE